MRMSQGVEWAVHVAVLLAYLPAGASLTSARLAEYYGLPPAYLAKHLQSLASAGIVETSRGRAGGYRLARPAAEITVLDVVEAIDGAEPAFRCTEIRRQGPTASPPECYSPICAVHAVMRRADAAWRADLARTTIADIAGTVIEESSPELLAKGACWLEGAVR